LAPKNKLQRFAENLTFDNLFQYRYEELLQGFPLKGNWGKSFFKNDNDIILELGCGKGEYTVGMARMHPDRNYIGMDIKGARMWRGLKTADEEGLHNVAFIRSRINLAGFFFDKDEVSEIWITFPDPQPRQIKTSKRLTAPNFLQLYAQFLKPGGIIHLKTDNIIFYEYTLDVILENNLKLLYSNDDVYGTGLESEVTSIQTFYEKKWLDHGTKIKYLKFQLENG
jgi:tRNA (guanine-N7-)-methyltransferase